MAAGEDALIAQNFRRIRNQFRCASGWCDVSDHRADNVLGSISFGTCS